MNDVKRSDPDPATNNIGDGGRIEDDSGQRLIPANKVNEIVSDRVNELNAKHASSIAALQSQVDKLNKDKAQNNEKDKIYSRAELDVFIGDGRLSQEEADRIVEKQMTKQVESNVMQDIMMRQTEESQQALIQRYVTHYPDVAVPGTQARQRIEQEVLAQQQLSGDQEVSLKHELLALRAIYGDDKKLDRANVTPKERDTHMDMHHTGNNAGVMPGNKNAVSVGEDGSISGLSAEEKAYYRDLISKGQYRNWKEVENEMNYANQALRTRAGSR